VVRPDERLSWPRTAGLGAQHVVAMFGASFVAAPSGTHARSGGGAHAERPPGQDREAGSPPARRRRCGVSG
ncbi:hypothetical protein ABZ927_31485, partial [Streptomyces massasporeus]